MNTLPPMALAVLLLLCFTAAAYSSTIGVQRISEVLELQERERYAPHVQVAAAQGVLRRLLPSHSSAFRFEIVSKEQCGGASCFIIENNPSMIKRIVDPEILIYGVTGVEISAGLHWYLKNWCGAHISWDKTGGAQLLSIPKPGSLPRVSDGGVLVQRPIPWSYYQNAVTSSYAFAWWDWKRWEKEIDWMALQGINLPLAFTGQEAIWQKVFWKFNLSSSDLNDFFGGPAFLAWSRMGNLHGWGGPLPQSWLEQQLKMQKKILQRMYQLGMTPVLPAFSGNVPAALRTIFPSAKITRLGNWFSVHSDPRWTCTYLLDATDPLFVEIGRAFIEQQLQEYGKTSHIYNCDTFDENTPPNDDPQYISSLGAAIFEGMRSGDENAVWLMQGWLFLYDPYWRPPQMKALLHSVALGKMVVLDLFAEVKPIWFTSHQFYGVPYIWCMLHNFAGNSEMYGVMNAISSGPIDALTTQNSTMVGVGMAMEGIEQNPVVYDLMSEMAFRREKVNVESWIDRYSTRRYGQSVSSIGKAWNILYHTIYNCSDGAFDKNRDVIVAFPDIEPLLIKEVSDSYEEPHLWYSTSRVIHALHLFLEAGEQLSQSNTYRYDLVDLTRQALAKYGNELFLEIIHAYTSKDVRKVAILSQTFLELVRDIDALLACDDGFLLGPWLESAKRLAQNEEQEKQFQWNARTQITMWFDNTDTEPSLLRDYGNKYWSGLLRDYYGPRAAIYFKYLVKSLEECEDFELKNWRRDWIKLTNEWQSNTSVYPLKGAGNAFDISKRLYKTYLQSQSLSE